MSLFSKSKSKADGEVLTDISDPAGLSWVHDRALRDASARIAGLEGRRDRTAAESAGLQVEAARDELRRRKALVRVGESVDVKGAEAALAQAEEELERVEGASMLVERELAEVQARLPEVRLAAQRASVAKYREEAGKLVREISRALAQARRFADRLGLVQAAADTSFPWASPEACEHGHAAGVSRGIIPAFLLTEWTRAARDSDPDTWVRDCRANGFADDLEAGQEWQMLIERHAIDPGEIQGYGALWRSTARGLRGPTRFEPNAFGSAAKTVPLLFQHDDSLPIGTIVAQADAKGLGVKGRILTTLSKGAEAVELLTAGVLKGLSVGFTARTERHDADGTRVVTSAELFEISLVTFPADARAAVASVGGLTVHAAPAVERESPSAGTSPRQREVAMLLAAAQARYSRSQHRAPEPTAEETAANILREAGRRAFLEAQAVRIEAELCARDPWRVRGGGTA